MTSEERADLAFDIIDTSIRKGHDTDIVDVILQTIREVRRETWEEAAKVAEQQKVAIDGDEHPCIAMSRMSEAIEAALRARSRDDPIQD